MPEILTLSFIIITIILFYLVKIRGKKNKLNTQKIDALSKQLENAKERERKQKEREKAKEKKEEEKLIIDAFKATKKTISRTDSELFKKLLEEVIEHKKKEREFINKYLRK